MIRAPAIPRSSSQLSFAFHSSMNNAIVVENLRKSYASKSGAVTALDGVSFQVPEGHIFGLLGPNGAGKSTTVKILGTVSAPTSGNATIFGCDVTRQALQARRKMTVVLQQ